MLHHNISNEDLENRIEIKDGEQPKQELDLYNLKLDDKDVIEIIVPFLQNHPEITKVELDVNNISDEGAKALADTGISKLNVNENRIGDKGAIALAHGNLTELDIRQNRVGEAGISTLAFAVKDKIYSLTKLNCSGNPGTYVEADIRREKDPDNIAVLRSKYDIPIPTLKDISIYAVKKEKLSTDKLPVDVEKSVKDKKIK